MLLAVFTPWSPINLIDYWIVGLLVPGVLYYAFGRASRRRAPAQLILPA